METKLPSVTRQRASHNSYATEATAGQSASGERRSMDAQLYNKLRAEDFVTQGLGLEKRRATGSQVQELHLISIRRV